MEKQILDSNRVFMRIAAQIISVLMHPLLMLTYILILMLLVNPYMFGVHSIDGSWSLVLMIFMSTFLIPAFAVLMMKFLGMIDSLEMHDRMERIGPYVITGIFYMWMAFYCFNSPIVPMAYNIAVAGATIALFIAFFLNLFTKISMHAVGAGGLVGMMLITTLLFSYETFIVKGEHMGSIELSTSALFLGSILLAGLTGSARLYLSAHELKDLYGGYLVGFAAQFIALRLLF